MKILFIAPDIGSGGAEKVLFNILKTRNNKDVFLISLTNIGFYGKKLKDKGYKICSLNLKKDFFSIFKIFKLYLLILRFNPDVVHTWLYHANLFGGICAKFAGIKKIYWSIHHDYETPNFWVMFEMKLLILLSHLIPNKIIFCSNTSKTNHIKQGYKVSVSQIIKNGVSTKIFKPNLKLRKKIRQNLKISNDCLLLGNISRYHPIKDHENLLQALSLLKKKEINFKCLLIGDGLNNKNKMLVSKIRFFKLTDNIILFGKSYEINTIINALDLNILSSKKESFPMVILEAMSAGIPCISTNVGDVKTIIGNTGWVVKVSDPYSLAHTIRNISKDRGKLKDYAFLAREKILKKYSIGKMIKSYKKLYDF